MYIVENIQIVSVHVTDSPSHFCNLSLKDVPVFIYGFTINCVWQIKEIC